MIIIKKLELLEIKEDEYHMRTYPDEQFLSTDPVSCKKEYFEVKTEHIQGERFILPSGKEFCIGWSEDVKIALGLPLTVHRNMDDKLERYKRRYEKREKSLKKLLNANWKERFKFFFRGVEL